MKNLFVKTDEEEYRSWYGSDMWEDLSLKSTPEIFTYSILLMDKEDPEKTFNLSKVLAHADLSMRGRVQSTLALIQTAEELGEKWDERLGISHLSIMGFRKRAVEEGSMEAITAVAVFRNALQYVSNLRGTKLGEWKIPSVKAEDAYTYLSEEGLDMLRKYANPVHPKWWNEFLFDNLSTKEVH